MAFRKQSIDRWLANWQILAS